MSTPETDNNNVSRRQTQKHRSGVSLRTTTSGVADSTISHNSFASGTVESLRLSQFPPPPTVIPQSPLTLSSGFSASPVGSSFTLYSDQTALARSGPRTPNSLLTYQSGNINLPPSSYRPPPHVLSQLVEVPSKFTNAPVPLAPPPSKHARPFPESPVVTSDPRILSPYDWHDGSSSISAAPPEERMLSTNVITGLLSSADSAISTDTGVYPLQSTFEHARYRSNDEISEMTYPPPPPRASSDGHPLDRIHHALAHSEVVSTARHGDDGRTDHTCETDLHSAQIHTNAIRKLTVLGKSPVQVIHVASPDDTFTQSGRTSTTTYDSTRPLRRAPGIPETIDDSPTRTSSPFRSGAPHDLRQSRRQRRASTRSNKSMKSQVSSFISATGERSVRLARQTLEWFRVKPLPPVPTLRDMSLEQEQQYRQHEGTVALPVLAHRANRLNVLLAEGRLPDGSEISNPAMVFEKIDVNNGKVHATGMHRASGGRKRQSMNYTPSSLLPDSHINLPSPSKRRFVTPTTRRGKIRLAVVVAVVAIVILASVIAGVLSSRRHSTARACTGNMTGASCTLDATCSCTSQSGQCDPVAAGLLSLLPTTNRLLNANVSSQDVAMSMFAALGAPPNNDCAQQVRVIDVAPALDQSTYPNRTAWAQSVLLWSIVLSQSPPSVKKIQDFILDADWSAMKGIDGPIPNLSPRFSTTQLGFTFDFAGQSVKEPPISFESDGQVSNEQLTRVDNTTSAVLDRVYTAASAMSSMRATAMEIYWQSTLKQDPKNFATFVSYFMASPLLLPFDANSSVSPLLTSSTSTPFPPPLSCYPGLNSSILNVIGSVETNVFALSTPSQQPSFNASCFADRPKYGTLNYLHLRQPFPDSKAVLPMQAAVLQAGVSPRVVLNNGRQFSALPTNKSLSTIKTDIRSYGTLHHMNHTLLDFFMAIPNVDLATELVRYVLSQSPLPPDNSSILISEIDSLPVIEIATIGSVLPGDVSSILSSFSTPSGQLFFGTDQSLALRTWAIDGTGSEVAWTDSGNAPEVVHDNSFSNTAFNEVWDPAYTYFHSVTDKQVNVEVIVTGFESVHLFTN